MLPSIIDGLLPVQKRVLLACHVTAKSAWKKTAAVLGETMARWHPHSEALGTAEWLVQNNFIDGWGQWGTRTGIDPISCAAMRYTKMKANPVIEEVAFKYVDHVKWEEDELEKEPVHLPTMVPFCLMALQETVMIAFGFKTEIPCYDIKNLVNRLLYLLGEKKKEIIIAPIVAGCNVIDGEFSEILTKGSGRINIQGKFTIDKKHSRVHVHGWSPRQSFQALLNKIDKYKKYNLLSNSEIGFLDQTGKGENQTNVVFEVIKQRNVAVIFKKMCEAISECLKSSLTYNIYAIDKQKNVVQANVDMMLIQAYNNYHDAFQIALKHSISKLTQKISEYKIIELIRPYISVCISNYGDNIKNICAELSNKSKVKEELIINIIEKYKIKRLFSIGTDIKTLEAEKSSLQAELEKSNQVCIKQYMRF